MGTLLSWTIGGETIALELDAAPAQGFERTAEVTEHPVETGAPVTDHVKPANAAFTLEGLITNAPVRLPTTQMHGIARAPSTTQLSLGGAPVSVRTLRWSGVFDRVRECDTLLDELVAARAVVTLTTSLRQVENLICTRYKVDRTAEQGDSIPVVLEFKQLRIVGTSRAAVPAVRRMQVRADHGQQPADNRSAVARGLDGNQAMTAAQQRAAALRRQQNGGT